MRTFVRGAVTAIAMAVALASSATAQRPGQGAATQARPALERLATVVARRLKLTTEQQTRLQTTTRRFATEREQLIAQERTARRTLRDQLARGDSADQPAVGKQLDELLRLQQRRSQLVADEQRELAAFLTPVQRAQFLAMQERAFRAAQQIRQKRAAAVERPDLRE